MTRKKNDIKNLPAGSASPFRVPEGYFEQLHRSIQNGVDALPSAGENTHPLPFRAPDGYFDTLTGQILARIDQPATVLEMKRVRIHSAWWWSAAAAVVFGLLLFKATLQTTFVIPPASEMITFEELQQSYVMDDLDESLLAEAVLVETADEGDENYMIQEYLLDNGTDLSQTDIEL